MTRKKALALYDAEYHAAYRKLGTLAGNGRVMDDFYQDMRERKAALLAQVNEPEVDIEKALEQATARMVLSTGGIMRKNDITQELEFSGLYINDSPELVRYLHEQGKLHPSLGGNKTP